MINNLHDSKISFHAALRKRCHLYIQPQVSDPHEKILIRHWRRIWNPHFSWMQQQQNGKAKNAAIPEKWNRFPRSQEQPEYSGFKMPQLKRTAMKKQEN